MLILNWQISVDHESVERELNDNRDLRNVLDELLRTSKSHAERFAGSAAIIQEALRRVGLEATLVGGSALEVYAPSVYQSGDLDFVVPLRWNVDWDRQVSHVFQSLGFRSADRHWAREEIFAEIPDVHLYDPVEVIDLGDLKLRIIVKEAALAYKIADYMGTRALSAGILAARLIQIFKGQLNENLAQDRLANLGWEPHIYLRLKELAESGERINEQVLGALHDQLRAELLDIRRRRYPVED